MKSLNNNNSRSVRAINAACEAACYGKEFNVLATTCQAGLEPKAVRLIRARRLDGILQGKEICGRWLPIAEAYQ